MEFISCCPVCNDSLFRSYLTSRDYFLSGEPFKVCECSVCGLLFTNPRPEKTEILKYYQSSDYLSHNTGQNSIFAGLYRYIRKRKIQNKFRLIKQFSSGNKILDLGCGTGEFIQYCSRKSFISVGIEPNEKARSFGINNLHQDIRSEEALEIIPADSMDVITLWHVLEHIHNLNEQITRLKQILKTNGILVIAVPNSDSWDARKYGEYWAAYDLPRHLYHFNKNSLTFFLEKKDFKLIEIVPMKYDAYYISLLSEKYKTGKKKFINAVFNGIRSNNFARKNNNNYSSIIFIAENLKSSK